MHRSGFVLLALACSCGGQVDRTGATDDAGSPLTEIPVGDAGMICFLPVVSLGDAADECTFSMTCTGGVTVEGSVVGPNALSHCSLNGSPPNDGWSFHSSSEQPLDCTSPATLAPTGIPCSQLP